MHEESQNPTFDFDKMKVENKENLPFAMVAAPVLVVRYADGVDCFCLVDQMGKIFTRDETLKLVKELRRFYQSVTDEEITEYNNSPPPERKSEKPTPKAEIVKRSKKVYLMRSNGDCKIGISIDPNERLKQISAPSIELLHSFDTDDATEAEEILHKTYQDKCINGEWFRLSDSDVEDIKFIDGFENGKFIRRQG